MRLETALTILHILVVIVAAAMLVTDYGHAVIRWFAALYLLAKGWLEAYQS